MTITCEQLKELLTYDPESGVFHWRVRRTTVKAGDVAGNNDGKGYISISINCRYYKAHRLAWLYVTGEWPSGDIDHINGNTRDNRIENLRVASRSENNRNARLRKDSTSGVKGVTWHKPTGKWLASVKAGDKKYHLGRFNDLSAAKEAVQRKREELHGGFANHG